MDEVKGKKKRGILRFSDYFLWTALFSVVADSFLVITLLLYTVFFEF